VFLKNYFAADEWERMTCVERAKRCRLLSNEAMHLALSEDSNLRDAYQQLADQWLSLAREIEGEM